MKVNQIEKSIKYCDSCGNKRSDILIGLKNIEFSLCEDCLDKLSFKIARCKVEKKKLFQLK